MKIYIMAIVLVLCIGCASMFEGKTDIEKKAFADSIGYGVGAVATTAVDILPIPAPVKGPIKDIIDYAAYGLSAILLGLITKKQVYDKVKASPPGKIIG